MKKFLALLLLPLALYGQAPVNVQKAGDGTNAITGNLVVGNGKSITPSGTGEIRATSVSPLFSVPWAQVNKTGSSLADLETRSAGALSSGTLPDDRFPATLPALNGSLLTALNADNVASGTLSALRLPAFSGDVSSSAGSSVLTLATVNSNVGSFGSATQAPTFTVDGKGRITAASAVTVTPAVGSITGLGTGVATLLTGAASGTGGPAGTTSPTLVTPNIGAATGTSVVVDSGSGSLPSAVGTVSFRVGSANSQASTIQADSWAANGLNLYGRASGGTRASTTATQAGRVLLNLGGLGHNGTGYTTSPSGYYQITAVTPWSLTNQETAHAWYGTDSGNTIAVPWMTLDTSGLALTQPLGVTSGGNGLSSATLGDIRYGSGTNTLAALAGNTSTTMAVLTQTGNGTVSAAPAWTSTNGTGNIARVVSPTFTTPNIGAATGTSVNLTGAGTLGGNLTFGTSGSVLNGTTGSIGLTATGTNQNITFTPTGTGVTTTSKRLTVTDTTASTSTTTGALTVAGGVGVAGAGYFGGLVSAAGTGANSERFGAGSVASATNTLAVGSLASASGSDDIAIGRSASASGGRGVALGVSSSVSTNNYGTAIGWLATSTGGVRIGPQGAAPTDAISIGGFNISASTGETRLYTGNRDAEVFFGAGSAAAVGYFTRINGVQRSSAGTGGILYLAGGKGGDAASTGGAVVIQTAAPGAGTTLTDRLTVAASGDASFASTTDATTGGAGSLTTAGGIYAAKKIITPSTVQATAGYVGTATNDAADAGEIGEYLTANNAISLSNGVTATVTSISLTAGDWDVTGMVEIGYTGATVANVTAGTSATAAFLEVARSAGGLRQLTGADGSESLALPVTRFSVASTTTVYLSAYSSFSAGSVSVFGLIRARRVR